MHYPVTVGGPCVPGGTRPAHIRHATLGLSLLSTALLLIMLLLLLLLLLLWVGFSGVKLHVIANSCCRCVMCSTAARGKQLKLTLGPLGALCPRRGVRCGGLAVAGIAV